MIFLKNLFYLFKTIKGDIMKIISWNVNGIESTYKDGCLEELIENETPDILCIQEVKSKKELPKLDGYDYVYNNPSKERGSGVAIYSKIKPIGCLKTMWPLQFDPNGRILTLKFPEFNLITVYCPSGASDVDNLCYKYLFYDKFTQYIEKLDKPAIICGDFNRISQKIDAPNPDEMRKKSGFLPQEEAWFNYILTDYIDAFRYFNKDEVQFSWWSYRVGRDSHHGLRLDYFLVNNALEDNLLCSKILEKQQGSDHAPIVLKVDFNKK